MTLKPVKKVGDYDHASESNSICHAILTLPHPQALIPSCTICLYMTSNPTEARVELQKSKFDGYPHSLSIVVVVLIHSHNSVHLFMAILVHFTLVYILVYVS